MEQRLTTTSYALLGLLSLRDWTTYELAKQVQRSLHWFWPRAERKLYDEPKRLVAAGFATAVEEHTGNRPRTVYRITRAGRTQLRRWLKTPPAVPSFEFEGMVKVFFANGAGVDDLRRTLNEIAHTAAERRDALATMADESLAGRSPFPERRHIAALTLRFQTDFEQLVEQWARWADQQVAEWHTTADAGSWDADTVLESLVDGRARRRD